MDYKDVNDYEVIYMIGESDDDAVEVLVNKYKPLIDRKLKKWGFMLKKRNLYLDDIRQELSLCVVNAAKKYKEDNNTLLYTYINKSLDGYLMNYLAKYLKEDNIISLDKQVDDDKSFIVDLIPDNTNNPDINLDDVEIYDCLNDFSMSLPMEKSIILEMYIEGYKISEIAKVSEKTEGSVRTTLSRLTKQLREEMSKKINI